VSASWSISQSTDEQERSKRLGDLSHHHGVQPGSLGSRGGLHRHQHL